MLLEIKKETIIICENIYKKRILEDINLSSKLYPINFMTIKEFIKKYTFDYDYKTILYIMKKYNVKYEVAKVYLNNLYYIENKDYKSDKLNFLVSLKIELENNNLLIYDPLFKDYLKNKDIIIYKYDLDKYYSNLFNNLNVIKIDKQYNNYSHDVYKFNTSDDEVEFVCNKICELINSGVDINKIKLANISNEYKEILKRYFDMFNIPLNLENKSPIFSTIIGKLFLDNYESNIENTIEKLASYNNNPIYHKIINICNKYRDITDYNEIKDIIIYDMKNTYLDEVRYDNAVNIIDFKDNEINDEYVFLLNFNQGVIPNIYKDEDYITDNLKDNLNIDFTIEKNKREIDTTIKSINNIKNLIITYKEKDNTKTYYPSNLVKLYNLVDGNTNNKISYSKLNDKLKLASYLDNLIKYGVKNEDIDLLYNNIEIPYLTYDNKFKGINKEKLINHLNNELNLSYTKMDAYNNCSFSYYLSYILKLNIYEETFFTILGSLFHYILEIGIKNDIDIDLEIDKYLNDKTLTNKEKFFINKLKKDLIFIINTIKDQTKLSKLDKSLEEEPISITNGDNIKITFTGYIDKIMYKEENDKTIIALIDYKTGKPSIDLKYFNQGLNMQLPVYLYLASNSKLKNIEIAGFYLQKILPNLIKIDPKKDIEDIKKDELKLEGYSTTNQDILSLFDTTYKDSSLIKSMKVKNDGDFYSYSKVLTPTKISKLIKLTENKIKEVEKNILEGNYQINPKKDKDFTSCGYCPYKDICYKTYSDEVFIEADKDLSFLGGEDNE